MEKPTRQRQSPKAKIAPHLLTLIILCFPLDTKSNPHQPFNLTWQIIDISSGVIIFQTSKIAPLNTWFPDLTVDLKALLSDVEHSSITLRAYHFYVCPGHDRDKKCGDPTQFYCPSWGCVSTGSVSWTPAKTHDLISIQRKRQFGNCYAYGNRPCNPLLIKFTPESRQSVDWTKGKTWGIRLYDKTRMSAKDPGNIFTIKLNIRDRSVAIGPNTVLKNAPIPPLKRPTPLDPPLPPTLKTPPTSNLMRVPQVPFTQEPPPHPLWELMLETYRFLNATQPNLTQSCWLCYGMQPPYYEAVAFLGNYTTSSDPSKCRWQQKTGGLTLQSVSGQGLCLGSPPSKYQSLCNQTISLSSPDYHIPPQEGWWACSTGLTPCTHGQVLKKTKGFCVLVQLLPRILYHPEEEIYQQYTGEVRRTKREPVSTLTLAAIFGIRLAGAGTGIASLAVQSSHYNSLRAAIDLDIKRIETSISHLQESLTVLSEVVLQNRRSLDLVFLQQRGLCAALGEECCFFTDHSGIIKESMAKVQEGLAKRKKEWEQQGWFESLYNRSPWLTTLVSTLIGPLVILLLLLTFGPCILNRLITFIKDRVNTVQLTVLRQQYQPLSPHNCRTSLDP